MAVCDFKPGDDVECINVDFLSARFVKKGDIYRCSALIDHGSHDSCFACGSNNSLEVALASVRLDMGVHLCSCSFRKVHRNRQDLSIERFLTIKPDQFEEPRKTPDKERKKEEVK